MLALAAPAGAQHYGGLDTGFEFTLSQRRTPPAGIELGLTTTSTYPCAGYRILSGAAWSDDTLRIALRGLKRPAPCVPLASVATGTMFLGDLGDTTIVLLFSYRGHEDRYRVTIAAGDTTVIALRRRFTSPGR